MPKPGTPSTISPELYRQLRAQVEAKQVAIYDGRSANTVEELDQIIAWSRNSTWTEEESAKRLAEASGNPLTSPEYTAMAEQLKQLRADHNALRVMVVALAARAIDTPAREASAVSSVLGPAPGPQIGAQGSN